MIYDYEGKKGYVSLWIGKCKDYNTIDKYLSTLYFDEGIEEVEHNDIWKKLFIPDNQDRDCEEELKENFNYEYFNQFEYDFGLSFDEDYREANVLDCDIKNLEELFDGFSYCDLFLSKIKELEENCHWSEYNTAIVLYDFKYEGDILEVEHENIHLYFLGYLKYDNE